MTTNLIISAHNDDACFSMGSYIAAHPDEHFVIVSPMDGVPDDEKGKAKHIKLNFEHIEACKCFENISTHQGFFFDDVYADTRDLSGLSDWFKMTLALYPDAAVFSPLGIHHPDHVLCRDIFIRHFRIDYFYQELPYFIRYPYLTENMKLLLCANRTLVTTPHHPLKEAACKKYESQVDEGVLRDIFVEERIWK